MHEQIRKLLERCDQVEELLGQADVLLDKKRYRELAQEHAYLLQVKEYGNRLEALHRQLDESKELLKKEKDPSFQQLIRDEITTLESSISTTSHQLETLLIPPDPRDSRTIIMELRAGTGGDEAALFVADCVRMYKQYAERKGWKYELLSCTPSELGGFKEYIMVI